MLEGHKSTKQVKNHGLWAINEKVGRKPELDQLKFLVEQKYGFVHL